MPTMPFNVLEKAVELKQLCNELAKTQKMVKYVLNGQVDFENIRARSIQAENIAAGTITANEILAHSITALQIAADTITAAEIAANAITATEINAGAVETDKLKAGAVTADKITVSQLSAIAANLGTITAGLIYGAYIATANGTYPRIELSNTRNLLKAFKSATNFLEIDADVTDPGIFFDNGSVQSSLLNFTAFGNAFAVNTTGDLLLRTTAGNITAQSKNGLITDIVSAINGKANAFTGFTGTFLAVQTVDFATQTTTNRTVTVANGLITNVV